MKACVALLIASLFLFDGFVTSSQRQGKMPNSWRTQVRKRQGQGSFALRGTAGGETSSTHSQNPSGALERPTGANCIQAGFFPTPGSCLHFYRCVDWTGHGSFYSAFHFTCPVGTVFDDKLDICNYPYLARRKECLGGSHTGSIGGTHSPAVDSQTGSGSGSQPKAPIDSQTGPGESSQTGSTGSETASEADSQQGPSTVSETGSGAGSQQGSTTVSQIGIDEGLQTGSGTGSQQGSSTVSETGSGSGSQQGSSTVSETGSGTGSQQGPSTVSQTGPDVGSHQGPIVTVAPDQGNATSEVTVSPSTEGPTQQASPEVFSLTCYTDNIYRRHPLYCNQYYYCINDGIWSVPIFTCPHDLVFDEQNQICARAAANLTSWCDFAPYSTPRPSLTTEATSTSTSTDSDDTDTTIAVTDPPADMTTPKTWTLDPSSLFDCPAPGYYPFEGDCIRFYKCVETDLSQLKGLLYRCPTGYGYSEERQRCLKEKDLPPCQRVPQAAHIRIESATPLYPDDLIWFFKN